VQRAFVVAGAFAVVACGSSTEKARGSAEVIGMSMPRAPRDEAAPPGRAEAPAISSAPAQPGDPKSDAVVAEALARVAEARKLPILHPVRGRTLGRAELLVQLKTKMAEEIPPGIVRLQGEGYRALELVPPDYDYEDGILKLLQSQIAGYYDPDDETMYLLDDLSGEMQAETLNHELVHALQDQSYDLAPLLKYKPGEGDAESAVQALVEGDATVAMIDAAGRSAMDIDEDTLATMFALGTEFSSVGIGTPAFVRDALVSPYVDGFRFVMALRRRGDWRAVDGAFQSMPTTTEQILHADKFLAHEPALSVPEPTIADLGPGFTAAYVDSMGELGFRLMFIDEGPRDMAEIAAAGWGGDRFVVAENVLGPTDHVYALAMRVRMDAAKDGAELEKMLDYGLAPKAHGVACRERPDLGPIAWMVSGRDAAIVAGPYRMRDGAPENASTCKDAEQWLQHVIRQK
jgi:hypothetical protein